MQPQGSPIQFGSSTSGSSEAAMLGGWTMKRAGGSQPATLGNLREAQLITGRCSGACIIRRYLGCSSFGKFPMQEAA